MASQQSTPATRQEPAEVLVLVVAAVLASVVVPGLIIVAFAWLAGIRGYAAAKHRRWWLFLTPERRWLIAVALLGIAIVSGSATWAFALVREGRFAALVEPAVTSALAGLAAAPGVFVLGRRRLRQQVLESRTSDVLATPQVAEAIRRGDDELTARSVGVSLDETTVDLRVIDPDRRMTAPVPIEAEGVVRYGIGIMIPEDRLTDFERSNHFTAPGCDLLVVPKAAGQMRALILAGSGTGKTELIAAFHAAANRAGMTSVLLDLKGHAVDAQRFGQDARAQREYLGAADDVQVVRGGWDFFDADRDQLLDRLLFVAPKTTSTDYYTQRLRRVLDIVIDGRGTKPLVRSLEHLTERLADPVKHLGKKLAGPLVEEDRHGATEASSVAAEVDAMFAPLRKYLPQTGQGWSFAKLAPGSATVVSLNPVLPPELLLANLILRDLRDFLAARAQSPIDPADQHPVSVTVDEFPQMVERDVDAAAEAAKILETARAANVGLILAGQSIESFSGDQQMQRRLLSAGVAIFLGRSALPDTVTEAAGSVWQLESAGDPFGQVINSAHAKQVFQILPQYVRRMHIGLFWVIHEGAVVRFLVFQTR